jgi:hypothetical protein
MTPKQNLAQPWPVVVALVLPVIVAVLTVLWVQSPATTVAAEPHVFAHPGSVVGQAELDVVKAKLAAGEEPWTRALGRLRGLAVAGRFDTAPRSEADQKEHARQAYANALVWATTGDDAAARRGIAILNVWGRTFTGYVPAEGQNLLVAGWIGALLAPAAEILRDHPDWKPADRERVKRMFTTAFAPALTQMSPWNGNVDLTQIDALMNIAVCCEDERLLALGLERLRRRGPAYFYLASDAEAARSIEGDGGDVAAFWSRPATWSDGLTQESCRDNGHHAQFALASALHAAEVAWHQGIDVYGEQRDRSVAAMELLARQLLERSMLGCCGADRDATTGDLYDTFAVGYHHYHHRLGIDLPHTERLLREEIGRRGQSEWNIFFETFTHGR